MRTIEQAIFEAVKNGFINRGLSIRDVMKETGVAKQTALRYRNLFLGKPVSRQQPTKEQIIEMPRNGSGCIEVGTQSLARARRFSVLGDPPEGHTVDASCGSPLCIAPEHVYFRKWKMFRPPIATNPRCPYCGGGTWKIFADVMKRSKRTGELVTDKPFLHYLCREKGCMRAFYGGPRVRPDLPVCDPRTIVRAPAMIFLGLLWGSSLNRSQIIPSARCKVRACPHPAFHGVGEYCYQHNHFFDYPISMTDSTLDRTSLFRPWLGVHSQAYTLAAEFLRSTENLEKSLRVLDHRGYLRNDHKNAGNGVVAPSLQASPMMHKMGHGKGKGSSKTTAGRHRAIARQRKGGRHSTKEKRWTRETLELEADKLLGITPEIKQQAEVMRAEQFRALASPTYPLCQSYEVLVADLTEEEERETVIASLVHERLFDHEQTEQLGRAPE